MKKATVILVRPNARRPEENHPPDVEAACVAARHLPCWVLLLGPGGDAGPEKERDERREARRAKRHDAMRRALGLEGIAKDGLSVFAPVELAGRSDAGALADDLAHYLVDVGLRMPLRQSGSLDLRLPADLDPALLAAAIEAVAVYPNTDVYLGDRPLRLSLRWESRRDKFRAPPAEVETDLIGSTPAIDCARQAA